MVKSNIPKPITQAELFAQVRASGCTISKTIDGEYRINWPGRKEASAYYTNDRDDALLTAKAIANTYALSSIK